MSNAVKIDRMLDETLVNLGTIVLRLADPSITRTTDEHRALAASVRQYARCANRSADPRVKALQIELEKRVRPPLQLVWSQ